MSNNLLYGMGDALIHGMMALIFLFLIIAGILLCLLIGVICNIKKKDGWKTGDRVGKALSVALLPVPLILLTVVSINTSIYYFGGEFEEKQETLKAYMSNGYKIIAKFEENGYFSMPSTYSCEDPDSVVFLDSDYKIVEPPEAYLALCK